MKTFGSPCAGICPINWSTVFRDRAEPGVMRCCTSGRCWSFPPVQIVWFVQNAMDETFV